MRAERSTGVAQPETARRRRLSWRTGVRSAFVGSASALLLAASMPAPGGAADVRMLEAVGAIPLRPDDPPTTPPRDAALRKALSDAVSRVALEMLPNVDFSLFFDELPFPTPMQTGLDWCSNLQLGLASSFGAVTVDPVASWDERVWMDLREPHL